MRQDQGAKPTHMKRKYTHEEAKELADSLDIKVEHGDPRSQYYGQLLSVEDEKRLGHDDQPVATGKMWSEAHSDVYLTVGIAKAGTVLTSGMMYAYAEESIPNGKQIILATSRGKPKIESGAVAGASLELPADLGEDAAKRQYVTEWLTHTLLESMAITGVGLVNDQQKRLGAFNWVATAAERCIRETGL